MAARKRKIEQNQTTRDKIKTGMIVKKMQDHIQDPEKTPMTGTQVRAAESLLARTMPTLSMSDVQTTEVHEGYDDLMQQLADMSGSPENFKQICDILGLEMMVVDSDLH